MNSQQPQGKLTNHLVEENSSLRNKLQKIKPQCGIKNIIFDFGGVLIDWNPRYLYRNIFQDEEKMEFFLKEICTSKWNLKQDAGRSFDEATQELISKFPQYKSEIKLFYSSWEKMIGGPIQKNVDLIDILKDEYQLFGLTNWSAETFYKTFDKYPFFKPLEGIVVSGTEKIIKPDAKIYKILLDRYQLIANESLFIDDNKDNIETANKLGFNTIHLKEETNLKEELKRLSIIKDSTEKK